MKENEEFDAIIVGSGLAGLFVALNLPVDYNILLITKSTIDQSDSFLAQGGICVLPEESDYDSFMEDTLKAGRYENKREAVAVMINESQRVIGDLIATGVEFDRKSSGDFAYTREAAHSRSRILHARDATGQEICSKLASKVAELGNVRIIEKSKVLDILAKDNRCFGVVASIKGASPKNIYGKNVILATGGVGGLFDRSTNYPHITGDALAIAHYNNVRLKDMNLVQIHPTSLYTEKPGRAFLISEAVRGEGAVLLDKNMNRFVDELLPRDLVSEAIYSQMKTDGKPYVWLCLAGHTDVDIALRFPEIYKHCLNEGFDITKECIPVVPAQHYFMGGIEVDLRSRTSMDNLYAVGETSCNGVHGRNRLASNSLLESLVFSRRAALDIAESGEKTKRPEFPTPGLDFYKNIDEKYNRLVLQEIGKKEKDD